MRQGVVETLGVESFTEDGSVCLAERQRTYFVYYDTESLSVSDRGREIFYEKEVLGVYGRLPFGNG